MSSDELSEIQRRVDAVSWHHKFEIVPGVWSRGNYRPQGLLQRLELPRNLSGKRVLDIGARDGFFSFACEERGADVTAIDYVAAEDTGFALVKELRGSKVVFHHANLFDPDLNLGRFDIILFLGVIYHLPDPFLALEIVHGLGRDHATVYIESTCADGEIRTSAGVVNLQEVKDAPLLLFAARNSTSFWDPNSACLHAMCEHVGLRVRKHQNWGRRQMVTTQVVRDPQKPAVNQAARGLRKRRD